ncbi:MAG: hypothetical protein II959_06460, partial [Clostridia bacterium]|nr:hypothetical protein [Clostridia bacterium]
SQANAILEAAGETGIDWNVVCGFSLCRFFSLDKEEKAAEKEKLIWGKRVFLPYYTPSIKFFWATFLSRKVAKLQ